MGGACGVADLGCGSGILFSPSGALRLGGRQRQRQADTDPLAVRASRRLMLASIQFSPHGLVGVACGWCVRQSRCDGRTLRGLSGG